MLTVETVARNAEMTLFALQDSVNMYAQYAMPKWMPCARFADITRRFNRGNELRTSGKHWWLENVDTRMMNTFGTHVKK